MNGWMRMRATSTPDTDPSAVPSTRTAGMAHTAGHPMGSVSQAKLTAASARTLLTDRSMPAVRMTTVMPHARMPKTDTWRSMSR